MTETTLIPLARDSVMSFRGNARGSVFLSTTTRTLAELLASSDYDVFHEDLERGDIIMVSAADGFESAKIDAVADGVVEFSYKDSTVAEVSELKTLTTALAASNTDILSRVVSLEQNTGTTTTQYPGVLSFSSVSVSGNESGTIFVNVTRTAGSDGTVTADLNYTGSSLTGGGTHYSTSHAAGAAAISLGPGVTSLAITLTVGDILGPGTIVLNMTNFSPSASAGQIQTTTVNVADTVATPTPGTIRLLTTGTTVNEPSAGNTTTMTITATRENGTSGAASADVTITPVSATVNTDYVGKVLSYAWADGVGGNATDTITINNNDSKLTNATFTAGLANVIGAAVGSPSQVNCTVTNTTASGSPGVDTVTGAVTHNGEYTIAGLGFGSKTISSNLILDTASDASMSTLWADAWPRVGDSNFYTKYRTPAEVDAAKAATGATGAAPSTVHARFTKYISGCNSRKDNGAQGGQNVSWFRNFTRPSFPFYGYVSYYHNIDPNWKFASTTGESDNNTKLNGYSNSLTTLYSPSNHYLEYNVTPNSYSGSCAYHIYENGGALGSGNTSNYWMPSAKNPMSNSWVKIEIIYKFTNASDGYMYVIEDGVLRDTPQYGATTPRVYQGITDNMTGTDRSIGYGGYARSNHVDNWRYAMLYAQDVGTTALARVILGNASTYAACTVREFQKPSAWSNSSITCNWNLGAFNSGTAYLYVIDSTDTVVNPTGKAVTIP